jgi:hypothetical protein
MSPKHSPPALLEPWQWTQAAHRLENTGAALSLTLHADHHSFHLGKAYREIAHAYLSADEPQRQQMQADFGPLFGRFAASPGGARGH